MTQIHSMSRLISMSQAVACDSQAVAGLPGVIKAVENRMQEGSG